MSEERLLGEVERAVTEMVTEENGGAKDYQFKIRPLERNDLLLCLHIDKVRRLFKKEFCLTVVVKTERCGTTKIIFTYRGHTSRFPLSDEGVQSLISAVRDRLKQSSNPA